VKYIDEYRDHRIAHALAAEISSRASRRWVLMEICGGQTHTIMRYGLDELLGDNIELVHGPGCPVCVTPLETIDKAIELASIPDVTLVSYGDMLRVPGSRSDLFQAKAKGGDVRVAYTPLEALKIARANPDRKVVFLSIGFETTAPANAMAAWQAKREGLTNFSMLVSHVLVPPGDSRLDELTVPIVCRVSSPRPRVHRGGMQRLRRRSSRDFRVPIVVGGFEPVDILEAVLHAGPPTRGGRSQTRKSIRSRSSSGPGNPAAQQIMAEVFEVADQKWRGIGPIPRSGLRLRAEYASYDADLVFGLADSRWTNRLSA
jgi:hydrogenase expression/formation protein HypD